MVGGELSLDQLELSYSPTLGFYRAPVQAVANGGVLVIDDFGRQACSPRELLNRWIVPLESRVDFLTLQTGQKFDFPFMTMIVFATNIKPGELVDEAFLRRIHYKIFAESPTRAEFLKIFENSCREHDLEFRPGVVDSLLANYFKPRQIQLRGCQPRDLIRAGDLAGRVSGRAAGAVDRAARGRLRRVFRGRPRGAGELRMTASSCQLPASSSDRRLGARVLTERR